MLPRPFAKTKDSPLPNFGQPNNDMEMRDKKAEKIIKKLCTRLAELRTEKGFSVEGLAHLTGLSSSTISELENQKTFPGSLTCVKICRALDVKMSDVFRDIGA